MPSPILLVPSPILLVPSPILLVPSPILLAHRLPSARRTQARNNFKNSICANSFKNVILRGHIASLWWPSRSRYRRMDIEHRDEGIGTTQKLSDEGIGTTILQLK